ncbi:hypothetical protein [Micromonospora sp. NPDC048063]|uniref:hypothetical protein n=1 Tax=Micromonospora sp. NPDC048063 TaxID=3364256 RepID=UPI00371EBA1F
MTTAGNPDWTDADSMRFAQELGLTLEPWQAAVLTAAVRAGRERAALCGARTGPVWKAGGEVCSCVEPAGHVERQDGRSGADHRCSCGAWFVDEVARRSPDT